MQVKLMESITFSLFGYLLSKQFQTNKIILFWMSHTSLPHVPHVPIVCEIVHVTIGVDVVIFKKLSI
jgi:hypothetical protein